MTERITEDKHSGNAEKNRSQNRRYKEVKHDMNDGEIIGVDHGYAAVKSPHFTFPAGVAAHDYEPYTQKDTLEYGGKYYVVGSGRQPLLKDKTLTDDYYLMTLAAVAREIELRNMSRTVRVHLAAGLPLTSFGREKKPFRDYLLRNRQPVQFRFEGIDYTVMITDVSLFPQGYAALSIQNDLRDEPSVILADIGGWTVDLMRVDNQKPDAATCRTLEQGMIRCLDEIAEQVRRRLGLSMTAAQIESILRGDTNSIADNVREIVDREAEICAGRLLSGIMECGMDYHVTPVVFTGGGAALMKRYLPPSANLARAVILDDVRLNAKAYEKIAENLRQRKSHE